MLNWTRSGRKLNLSFRSWTTLLNNSNNPSLLQLHDALSDRHLSKHLNHTPLIPSIITLTQHTPPIPSAHCTLQEQQVRHLSHYETSCRPEMEVLLSVRNLPLLLHHQSRIQCQLMLMDILCHSDMFLSFHQEIAELVSMEVEVTHVNHYLLRSPLPKSLRRSNKSMSRDRQALLSHRLWLRLPKGPRSRPRLHSHKLLQHQMCNLVR